MFLFAAAITHELEQSALLVSISVDHTIVPIKVQDDHGAVGDDAYINANFIRVSIESTTLDVNFES